MKLKLNIGILQNRSGDGQEMLSKHQNEVFSEHVEKVAFVVEKMKCFVDICKENEKLVFACKCYNL